MSSFTVSAKSRRGECEPGKQMGDAHPGGGAIQRRILPQATSEPWRGTECVPQKCYHNPMAKLDRQEKEGGIMRNTRTVLLLGLIVLLLGLAGCLFQPPHTVSTPNTPTGPSSGEVGQSLTFSTGGASCSRDHPVEYRFDWDDGTYSSWSSSSTASKVWSSPGTYEVRAQARCASDHSVVSGWSSAKTVVIEPATSHAELQILDWQLLPYDNPFMPWVIRGHAKNVSGHMLSYAEVRGQFYDAANVLLCTWFDNVTDLPANVVWEFNIYYICSEGAERVDHATVTVGNCW